MDFFENETVLIELSQQDEDKEVFWGEPTEAETRYYQKVFESTIEGPPYIGSEAVVIQDTAELEMDLTLTSQHTEESDENVNSTTTSNPMLLNVTNAKTCFENEQEAEMNNNFNLLDSSLSHINFNDANPLDCPSNFDINLSIFENSTSFLNSTIKVENTKGFPHLLDDLLASKVENNKMDIIKENSNIDVKMCEHFNLADNIIKSVSHNDDEINTDNKLIEIDNFFETKPVENVETILAVASSSKHLLDLSIIEGPLSQFGNSETNERKVNEVKESIVEPTEKLIDISLFQPSTYEFANEQTNPEIIENQQLIAKEGVNSNTGEVKLFDDLDIVNLINEPDGNNVAVDFLCHDFVVEKNDNLLLQPTELNNLLDTDMPESMLDISDVNKSEQVSINEPEIKETIICKSVPQSESKRKAEVEICGNFESKLKKPRALVPPTSYEKLRSPLMPLNRNRSQNSLGSVTKKLALDEGVAVSASKRIPSHLATLGSDIFHSKLPTPTTAFGSSIEKPKKCSANSSSQIPTTNLPVLGQGKLNFASGSSIPPVATGIKSSSIPTSIGFPNSSSSVNSKAAKGSRLPTLKFPR